MGVRIQTWSPLQWMGSWWDITPALQLSFCSGSLYFFLWMSILESVKIWSAFMSRFSASTFCDSLWGISSLISGCSSNPKLHVTYLKLVNQHLTWVLAIPEQHTQGCVFEGNSINKIYMSTIFLKFQFLELRPLWFFFGHSLVPSNCCLLYCSVDDFFFFPTRVSLIQTTLPLLALDFEFKKTP